jgi:transcription elongation factor GreB
LTVERTNPVTPAGFAAMQAEYHQLMAVDRPRIVEIVSWAAGNGDRSENGDYIYGRQKLRDIDRRAGFLARRMKAARIIDPAAQADHTRLWFGGTAIIADADDNRRTITLVGDDESDAAAGRVGWGSPLARALRGAAVSDVRRVTLPAGTADYEILALAYPPAQAQD